MSFTSESKQQIALKKLSGKAQTKNQAEFFNEPKSTGITVSAQTVFGEAIPESPSDTLYAMTDEVVEYIRLPLVFAPESEQDGLRHGFVSSLPLQYESNSSNEKSGTGNFINSKAIHTTKGDIQLIPPSFGLPYEVKVYIGGDATTKGSGERMPVTDERFWYFDYFNGIFFQQNPGEGSNSANPDYIEAFVYVGKKSNETNNSSLSSLWEVDPNDANNLVPTSVIDGDTGCFALDFNTYLDNDNEVHTSSYSLTSREDAKDLLFEIDNNGNITTKE